MFWVEIILSFIFGTGLGLWLSRSIFLSAFDKYIETIEGMSDDLIKEFDNLPIEPKQLNKNPVYTVMDGSERIH
jgi:hypothetical protein